MDSCLPNFKGMREAPGLYHEIGWNVEISKAARLGTVDLARSDFSFALVRGSE